MLQLGNLHPPKGSVKKSIRRGRGEGSGKGKTSGKGHKGQNARSGISRLAAFEGGQMPLFRRVPKKGFKNPFKVEYSIVNIADLNHFGNETEINPRMFFEKGIVNKALPIKLLASGDIKTAVTVKVHAASQSAIKKIEDAGGKVEVIS